MIGLLAIAGDRRGRGYARSACEAIEAMVRASPHGRSLRIGIVETNRGAFDFWRHLGFRETGERKRPDEFIADVVLLEKPLGG